MADTPERPAASDSFDAGPGGQITHMHTPDTALVYVYRIRIDAAGWWWIEWQYGYGSSWQAVARVFGERRAEIVRDALSEEANERV